MQAKTSTIAILVATILIAIFKESCTDTTNLNPYLAPIQPKEVVTVTVRDTVFNTRTVVKWRTATYLDQVGSDTVYLTSVDTFEKLLYPPEYATLSDTITGEWGKAALDIVFAGEVLAYDIQVDTKDCPPTQEAIRAISTIAATPISIVIPQKFSIGAGVFYNFPTDRINWGLTAGYKNFGVHAIIDKQAPIVGATYSIRW